MAYMPNVFSLLLPLTINWNTNPAWNEFSSYSDQMLTTFKYENWLIRDQRWSGQPALKVLGKHCTEPIFPSQDLQSTSATRYPYTGIADLRRCHSHMTDHVNGDFPSVGDLHKSVLALAWLSETCRSLWQGDRVPSA